MVCLPTGKNSPLVHSSASALSTAGVVGHGPSSKVSTTSLSVRKSNCLYCRKPKPGPPVVSITTMRLTPSASGLAQAADRAGWAAGTGAGAGAGLESEAVVSTSSFSASFAGAGNGSALRAATVWGGAASARGEEVQNQTAVITTAVITLASIRPNALRIATLSTYSGYTHATAH